MSSASAQSRISVVSNHILPDGNGPQAWSLVSTSPNPNARPIRVCITGAAGQIAYSLIFAVASGRMLGPHQPVIINLLDIPKAMEALNGVIMEIEDCAFPLVHGVFTMTDPKEAFKDVQVVLMLGAFPRGPGMERKDLLKTNVGIFKDQGEALDKYASCDVKVCVVGNPANTNCLTLMNKAKSLPRTAFSALTRLDQNRAVAQLSKRLATPVHTIDNVIIWGNHSNTQYPDISHAQVRNAAGVVTPVRDVIRDDVWLQNTFIPKVQQRGAEVIKVRKASSAASAANAVVDHVRTWLLGTQNGSYASMAVASDGSYGVPVGLIYSFPVTCKNGSYSIVQGLHVDAFSKKLMDKTTQELIEERDLALSFL